MNTNSLPGGHIRNMALRVVAERAVIGGLGPVAVGSPVTVADEMERQISEVDMDGLQHCLRHYSGDF
ncbi:hypothetical protein P885DRAFT_82372 [Corynascus similis CBS 632.67]